MANEPRSGERFFRRSAAYTTWFPFTTPSAVATLFRRYRGYWQLSVLIGKSAIRPEFPSMRLFYDLARISINGRCNFLD
jgi:hypothetical protein